MNESVFRYLNTFVGQSEVFDQIVVFIAKPLGVLLLIGLVLFLFLHNHEGRGMHNVVVILGSLFLTYVFSEVIKYMYVSPRPFLVLEDIQVLFEHGRNDSFPSAHSAFFFSMGLAVFFYHRLLGTLFLFMAVLIGIARIMAGVHWPFDVIAGFALGGAVTSVFYLGYRKLFLKNYPRE